MNFQNSVQVITTIFGLDLTHLSQFQVQNYKVESKILL